ncbi:helix-turn-helix domain-containing protein [Ralstonia pseudosolanacearum]|nr:helix-turn-helix domain-containing protein [Ralstonia pseudosolanacearum]
MPDSPSAEQIRAAREAAVLTQSQAAALIYRTARNWQQWEGGERRMDPALWELFELKLAQNNACN